MDGGACQDEDSQEPDFVESSRFQVQKDSLKDYRKEKLTPNEIRNNKMYLKDNCLYR